MEGVTPSAFDRRSVEYPGGRFIPVSSRSLSKSLTKSLSPALLGIDYGDVFSTLP